MLNRSNILGYIIVVGFTSLSAALFSCSTKNESKGASGGDTADSTVLSHITIPQVPDSLTEPSDRADYLLAHFWDGVDFSESKVLTDTVMLEQGISDFIAVMDFCTPKGLETGVNRLLDRASASSPSAYERVSQLAERYLWEPESPFRSERYYTPFVEYAIAKGGDDAIRAEDRLEQIKRNFPGTMAPDFIVKDRKNRDISLRRYSMNYPMTILMFYEPDCESCNKVIDAIKANRDFAMLVSEGRVGFIAIFIGNDEGLWRRHASSMPEEWEVCIDSLQKIDNEDLYVVRATPSFYLIDSSGRIVVKDGTLSDLYKALYAG